MTLRVIDNYEIRYFDLNEPKNCLHWRMYFVATSHSFPAFRKDNYTFFLFFGQLARFFTFTRRLLVISEARTKMLEKAL